MTGWVRGSEHMYLPFFILHELETNSHCFKSHGLPGSSVTEAYGALTNTRSFYWTSLGSHSKTANSDGEQKGNFKKFLC